MLTRIDHVLIAAQNLEQMSRTFRETLGLNVVRGGEHANYGTYNELCYFDLSYLELIAVRDRAVAESAPLRGALLRFLEQREGLFAYVVASDDIEAVVARAQAAGVPIEAPARGERRRPDGSLVAWRSAGMGLAFEQRVIPFIVQHEGDDGVRLADLRARGFIAEQRTPVVGLDHLDIAVRDLDTVLALYAQLLDWQPAQTATLDLTEERVARLQLGNAYVDLYQPLGDNGPAAAALERQGEGLFRLALAVRDLGATADFFRREGLPVSEPAQAADGRRYIMTDPSRTHGAALQWITAV